MKSKSKPSDQPKLMPTEQQFEAMCRRVEAVLLNQGATPAEVALLRKHSGDVYMSAAVITMMKTRIEYERQG